MVRVFTAVVLMVAFTAPAFGRSTPPMLEAHAGAWGASHIVVVDSTGKILEVWKGDLKVGDKLPVNEKTWKLRLPQLCSHGGAFGPAMEGKKVHADRVI